MNIFGVGPLELVVVLIFALLVLGPEGMVKAGRILGQTLHKLYQSEFWQAMRGSGDLMQKLSRDLGINEDLEEMRAQLSQTRVSMEGMGDPPPGGSVGDLDQSPQDQKGEVESESDQDSKPGEEAPHEESTGNGEETGS
ncbi:MAG: twin-arginine translocase TatA/TatE family subunit [Anaerolineales bacterium]